MGKCGRLFFIIFSESLTFLQSTGIAVSLLSPRLQTEQEAVFRWNKGQSGEGFALAL